MGFSSTEYANRYGRRAGARQGSSGIGFDMAGFSEQINATKSRVRAAIRPTAQAGTQVIYEQARFNAPQSEEAHFFYGKQWTKSGKTSGRYGLEGNMGGTPFTPGNLSRSIYQVYSKRNSSAQKAVYHVSWNTKPGKQNAFAPYGWMVELGTSNAPAHPFLARALYEARGEAGAAMKAEFISRVQKR
jgi:HK97 gp10 family phage protein